MKLQSVSIQDESILQQLIIEQREELGEPIDVLERGLSSDHGLLCLGIDREKRFVVLVSSVLADETALVKGLGQLGWLSRHQDLLGRLFHNRGVDASRPPRLILVCPSFSKAVVEAAAWMPGTVSLFRYRAIEVNQERALLFDSVVVGKAPDATPNGPEFPPPTSGPRGVGLTAAERNFFESSTSKSPPA